MAADAAQWNALLVLSVTMMALPYGLLFWAEQHVTSSLTRDPVFRRAADGLTFYAGHDASQGAAPGGLCHDDGFWRTLLSLFRSPS